MKIIHFSISVFVTLVLIVLLGTKLLLPAPLAVLLSPQQGVWQNAEPAGINYSADLSFPQLKGKSEVYFDDRLVPHVFAEDEQDVYFIQGYLHAKFRLWQMEFQTHAAAGRLSEIMGEKVGSTDFLNIDRYFRRLGMGYAAEKSLLLMEADTATKLMCDAYTAGVNSYIESLTTGQLPLEYKLLSLLVKHSGKVVTHRQLLSEVWGAEYTEDAQYLRVYMGYLRKKLEPTAESPKLILTEHRIGYRLAI